MSASIPPIGHAMDTLLAQMRRTAQAAGFDEVFGSVPTASAAPGTLASLGQTAPTGLPASGFAGVLKEALDKVAAMQNSASAKAQAFTLGEPDVSLNDVMIDTQKASLSLQATVQVRNRLVAAYQEIANMAV